MITLFPYTEGLTHENEKIICYWRAFAALSLASCDGANIVKSLVPNEDDSSAVKSEGNASQAASSKAGDDDPGYDDEIFNKSESQNKLIEYGQNTDFELTTKGSSSDSEEATTFTLGMKGNLWWEYDISADGEIDGMAYQLHDDGTCALLDYDSEQEAWVELVHNVGETQFEEMFKSASDYLYPANGYFANEGFEYVGEGSYVGRTVMKFEYHARVSVVSLDHEYYVDKDLGIDLYNYAANSNSEETEWAKIETTSF